jgi:hypothetical protein
MTLEHRAPTQAPIGYDELVQQVIGGRADEAIAALRSLAASSRSDPLLSEEGLGRLCVSLLYTWNLAEEALPLIIRAAGNHCSPKRTSRSATIRPQSRRTRI